MIQGPSRKAHRLLYRAQHGNAEAFAQIFQQSAQTIWRVAFSIVYDEQAASDVLQETALKAWRSIPHFKEECAPETWLVRIAINVSYDIKKRANREEPHDVQENELDGHHALAGQQCPIDHEELFDVQRALNQLSPDDRLILSLFYAQDLPTKEIASILDITDSAARARLTRARARFKDLYTREDSRGETREVPRQPERRVHFERSACQPSSQRSSTQA